MTQWVLGIDGGGTKTNAVIVDDVGHIVGYGFGGPSNYGDVGMEKAQDNIKNAVEMATTNTVVNISHFNAVFMGMANVVSDRDKKIIKKMGINLDLAPIIEIDHDCRIALEGGLTSRPGIVLIAGTGSSCFGMNKNGQRWRSGGWGSLIDDDGSGYWLGIQAMRAAVRDYDGRGEGTLLSDLVMKHLSLQTMNEIMYKIYGVKITRKEIASMAKIVLSAAERGDQISQKIIEEGIHLLTNSIQSVAKKLSINGSNFEIALTGGMMKAKDIFRDPLIHSIRKRMPFSKITMAELPPVVGAGMLGLKLLNIPITVSIQKNLWDDSKKLF